MLSVFGAAALFLASVGLHGVLSFSVNQRTHELGLRVALGATPGGVVRLVLNQAGLQLALGLVLGMGLSMLLGRGLSFVLFDVAATDMGVFMGVAVLLTITSAFACLVPATRATRVDPAVAMHTE
jgi:putative ABC transport system permease protein